VKLRVPEFAILFTLGAAASLIGDHSHVATGTTEYLTDAVPFVWSSPIWFPLLVGLATVSLAELRLHLPAPRTSVTSRRSVGHRRNRHRRGRRVPLCRRLGRAVRCGAVVAEIAAKDREPSVRSSASGTPAPR
jgi:hypothetical protein